MFSEGTWRQERDASWEQKENKVDSNKHMEQMITEWAKELQTVSEVRTVGLTPCDIYNIVQNLCTVYYVYILFFFYLCTVLWCDETRISPFSETAGTEEEENLDSAAIFGIHNLVSTETGQPGTSFR